MRYFQCKPDYGLFVPVEKAKPIVDAQAILRQTGGTEAPKIQRPFKETETTSRLVKEVNQLAGLVNKSQQNGPMASLVKPINEMSGIELVPRTPVKNVLPDHLQNDQMVTPGTVGKNSMSRELSRRQDEVNLIRRQVEPLLLSAQRLTTSTPNGNGLQERPSEQLLAYLRALVAKLSVSMSEYDKVVARYERYLQKIIQHMETKRQSSMEAEHQSSLKVKEIEDLTKRLASAENQAKLIRTEYEQAQRNLSQQLQLCEELEAENVQLRKLQASSSPDEAMEALRAALNACREENLVLRREIGLLQNGPNHHRINESSMMMTTSTITAEKSSPSTKEVLRAKDAQEAYFKEIIEGLKKEHSEAIGLLQSQLDGRKAELEVTREQLVEQQARAQRYHEALDRTADKAFDESEDMRKRLTETVEAMERLVDEKHAIQMELAQSQAKLVEMSSNMARQQQSKQPVQENDGDAEKRELKRQIETMEQTILSLNESLNQQEKNRRPIQTEPSSSASTAAEVQRLQRQLAQVEFEKVQIEKALTLRNKTNGKPPHLSRERAEKIKEELRQLKPALPTLVERIGGLLGLFRQSPHLEADSELTGCFERLESSRQVALGQARSLLPKPGRGGCGDGGGGLDRTPTMNRRVSSGVVITGPKPLKLF